MSQSGTPGPSIDCVGCHSASTVVAQSLARAKNRHHHNRVAQFIQNSSLSHREPAWRWLLPKASLFVDDREENVAGARAGGLRARHAPDPDRLVEYLRDAGIKIWTERDGDTGDANDHEDTA
jgi:FMN phosphatase YigB (HAD superfamily)